MATFDLDRLRKLASHGYVSSPYVEQGIKEIERLRGALEAVEVMLRPGIGQATADVAHKVVLNWLGQGSDDA